MKKGIWILVIVAVAAGIFLFSGQKKETAPQSQAVAEYKDEIVFCQGNDLMTMDISIGMQERSCSLTNNMFDSLFTFDEKMNVIPELATEYKWLDDKTLEVKVRQGVKFHDGSDMTIQDVKFSMDHINEVGYLFGATYDSTEVVDDSTIRIKLKTPNAAFLNLIAVPYAAIVSEKAYAADPKGFGQKPIGTGAYKLKEFKEGDYYTLERFDDHWAGPAKTRLLTMRIIPETAQRIILLETGEVDAAYEIPPSSARGIKENSKLQLLTCDSMKIVSFTMNCSSKGPMGNVLVRRAMQYAIDRQTIVDSLLYGYGRVVNSMIPLNAVEYVAQGEYSYDVEKAKELLKEAGYENGLKLSIWTDAVQINTETSQVLQNQLAKVGVDLSIIVQDINTTSTQIKAGTDFDSLLDFFNATTGHADQVFKRVFLSTSSSNWANYRNLDYDKMYEKQSATPSGPERDELTAKLNEFVVDDAPLLPLYGEEKIVGANAGLEGIKLSPIGSHEYRLAVVKK